MPSLRMVKPEGETRLCRYHASCSRDIGGQGHGFVRLGISNSGKNMGSCQYVWFELKFAFKRLKHHGRKKIGVFIFSFLSLLNPQMKQLKIFAIYNLRQKEGQVFCRCRQFVFQDFENAPFRKIKVRLLLPELPSSRQQTVPPTVVCYKFFLFHIIFILPFKIYLSDVK